MTLPPAIRTLLDYYARFMEAIPMSRPVEKGFEQLHIILARVHRYAPIVGAALAAALTVQLILWLLKLPLSFGWRLFGLLASNDPQRLAVYGILAQLLAFVIASKVAYELAKEPEATFNGVIAR